MIPFTTWLRVFCIVQILTSGTILLFQILNGYPVNGAVLIPLALLFVGWALIHKKRDRT
ncbi:hypothetical protein [Plantibacter sp. YIM 135249]|uniref:hypothetical protein n=1 Tax=Plantibacter sp. YIM 135249 TaxID=3423918 RepID=UPI003D326EC1